MSAPIGPGDYVEAMEDGVRVIVHKGSIYVVEEVFPGTCNCLHANDGHGGLNLRGIPKPYEVGIPSRGWCAHDFRPIYRPKREFIESLNVPAPSEMEPA